MFLCESFVEYISTLHENYVLVKGFFHFWRTIFWTRSKCLDLDSTIPLLQAPLMLQVFRSWYKRGGGSEFRVRVRGLVF